MPERFFNGEDSSTGVFSGSGFNTNVSGGFFSTAVNNAFLKSGLENATLSPSKEYDGKQYKYLVRSSTPVASVGLSDYKSIYDAFEAANSSENPCTVKLLADVSTVTTDTLVISNSNLITLDLNAKTFTTRLKVNNGAKCQIEGNGTLKVPDNNDGYLIKVLPAATLTIVNGTFTGTTASGAAKHCIWGYGASGNRATIVVNNGNFSAKTETGTFRAYYADVTINNATVSSSGKYPRSFVSATSGYFVIEDGTFSSQNAIWRSSATTARMTINGGKFILNTGGAEPQGIFYLSTKANTLKITGGYFAANAGGIVNSASNGATNLTVQGGKYSIDASTALPASDGYKWQAMNPNDTETISGATLTYEVVAN